MLVLIIFNLGLFLTYAIMNRKKARVWRYVWLTHMRIWSIGRLWVGFRRLTLLQMLRLRPMGWVNLMQGAWYRFQALFTISILYWYENVGYFIIGYRINPIVCRHVLVGQ
jgi:hypothetical protein